MCEAPMRRISKLDEAVGDATLRFQISYKGGVYREFYRGLSTRLVKGDTQSFDYGSDAPFMRMAEFPMRKPQGSEEPNVGNVESWRNKVTFFREVFWTPYSMWGVSIKSCSFMPRKIW